MIKNAEILYMRKKKFLKNTRKIKNDSALNRRTSESKLTFFRKSFLHSEKTLFNFSN